MRTNKVIFYNTFHNGDIHLSREFVRKMTEVLPNTQFYYAHKNNPNLLADIPRVKFCPYSPIYANMNYHASFVEHDTLHLNTWYGAMQNVFNTYGISFDTLYYLFANHLRNFNIDIKNISGDLKDFYPTIDFNHYYIENAKNYLENNPCKKVYISNGESLSGQAVNFNMASMINQLADANPDVLFILSNSQKDILAKHNIILASNIIKKPASGDLNENAFISTKCDLIVGRSSGTYTFAMIKENMFNPNKTMLSFSTIGSTNNDYWLGPDTIHTIKYDAIIQNYNFDNGKQCYDVVQNHLKRITG